MTDSARWNAADYAANSRGQQAWALSTMDRLETHPGDAVLDIGCGDGKVTVQLARRVPAGHVVGIDSSADMVRLATDTWGSSVPNVEFRVMDAQALDFSATFDCVFSNSTLHWIRDHPSVLRGVARALKPGGRVVLSMGGRGTAEAVHHALADLQKEAPWALYIAHVTPPHHFFGPEEYEEWLSQVGLRAHRVALTPKQMRHADLAALEGWLRTTWFPYLEGIPVEARAEFITEWAQGVLGRCVAADDGAVLLPMVNLEVEAERPS